MEILAPAGNKESLISAVQNGANAVYFGLEKFNARMKAGNFSLENLAETVDYCHLFGVKVYVTLNTSLKQEEYFEAVELLNEIYKANCDGVILTDLSLIEFAAKNFPKPFEIVASTQLNVHDLFGANYLKKLGATTVVLARETPLENIAEICQKAGIRVECFVHGAICVSQSGQCLFSSMVGGNSGNRGLCAQPCRQLYSCVSEGKEINSGYLLSPKDLCGLNFAKQLENLGVCSLKIEGRNRRSQYAGLTSRVYSGLFENDQMHCEALIDPLRRIYNRGNYLSTEYLSSQNEGIIYPKVQGHIGVDIGAVERGILSLVEEVEKGDEFKILRNGVEVGSARALESGKKVKASFSGEVMHGDRACITSDQSQLKEISDFKKKLNANFVLVGKVGQKLKLFAKHKDVEVALESDFICESAKKQATSKLELTQQLQKTNETCYTICDIVFHIDEIFVPKSVINSLRRQALEKLTEAIIDHYNGKLARKQLKTPSIPAYKPSSPTPKVAVVCKNINQFEQAISDDRLYFVTIKLETIDKESIEQCLKVSNEKRFYIDVPAFADLNYLAKILPTDKNIGIVAHNIGAIEFASMHKIPYIAGSGLNIFNSYIAKTLTPDDQPYVVSQELTIFESQQMMSKNVLQFVDGQLVLMKFVHCPFKLNFKGNCKNCNFKQFEYVDKLKNKFKISRTRCRNCTFELSNGNKLSVVSKLKQPSSYLVDFNKDVVEHYLNLNLKIDDNYIEQAPYTKGRLFDKVT